MMSSGRRRMGTGGGGQGTEPGNFSSISTPPASRDWDAARYHLSSRHGVFGLSSPFSASGACICMSMGRGHLHVHGKGEKTAKWSPLVPCSALQVPTSSYKTRLPQVH